MSDNEIRIDDNFLLEVKLDDKTGETVVGRNYRGKGFKGMPLITLFTKAENIGNRMKIAAATERGTA